MVRPARLLLIGMIAIDDPAAETLTQVADGVHGHSDSSDVSRMNSRIDRTNGEARSEWPRVQYFRLVIASGHSAIGQADAAADTYLGLFRPGRSVRRYPIRVFVAMKSPHWWPPAGTPNSPLTS
jgi:hypothetical protein